MPNSALVSSNFYYHKLSNSTMHHIQEINRSWCDSPVLQIHLVFIINLHWFHRIFIITSFQMAQWKVFSNNHQKQGVL